MDDQRSGSALAASPISVVARLSFFDVYRASVYAVACKSWWILVVAVLFFSLVIPASPENRHNLINNFAPLFVVLGVCIFILPLWTSRSLFKSQFGLGEEKGYTFSDDGISIQSNSSSAKATWSHIYRVFETKSFFFMYVSRFSWWLIPKRAIRDEAALVALRRMLITHVRGKVKLQAKPPESCE